MTVFTEQILPLFISALFWVFGLVMLARRVATVRKTQARVPRAEKIGYISVFILLVAYIALVVTEIFFKQTDVSGIFPILELLLILAVGAIEFALWYFVCKQRGYSFSKSNIVGGCMVVLLVIGLIVTQVVNRLPYQGSWYSQVMGLSSIEADGSTQKIALIDSGISKVQKNTMGKNITIQTLNMADGGEYDTNGHGSAMFYILNIITAPEASVLSIRVMDQTQAISGDTVADAIWKAIEENCTVINLSIGGYKENERVRQAIEAALEKNITVVASAGDYGDPDLMFPAKLPGVISVGAIEQNSQVWKGTNNPQACTILAPGVDITTFRFGGNDPYDTERSSGTSQATALISGYVARLKDHAQKHNISLSNEKIVQWLTKINKGEISYKDVFTQMLV